MLLMLLLLLVLLMLLSCCCVLFTVVLLRFVYCCAAALRTEVERGDVSIGTEKEKRTGYKYVLQSRQSCLGK